jgi:hypothetical protein
MRLNWRALSLLLIPLALLFVLWAKGQQVMYRDCGGNLITQRDHDLIMQINQTAGKHGIAEGVCDGDGTAVHTSSLYKFSQYVFVAVIAGTLAVNLWPLWSRAMDRE